MSSPERCAEVRRSAKLSAPDLVILGIQDQVPGAEVRRMGATSAPPGRSWPIQSNPIDQPRQRALSRPGRSWPYAGALLHFGSTRLDSRLKSGDFSSRNPCASQARGYPLSRGSA